MSDEILSKDQWLDSLNVKEWTDYKRVTDRYNKFKPPSKPTQEEIDERLRKAFEALDNLSKPAPSPRDVLPSRPSPFRPGHEPGRDARETEAIEKMIEKILSGDKDQRPKEVEKPKEEKPRPRRVIR